MTETIVAEVTDYPVTWETLPPDFELPDDPVENLEHPTLANDLRELLLAAGLVTESVVILSNLCPQEKFVEVILPTPKETCRRW